MKKKNVHINDDDGYHIGNSQYEYEPKQENDYYSKQNKTKIETMIQSSYGIYRNKKKLHSFLSINSIYRHIGQIH
ncbi:hypothetical protein DERP_014130 [Dermatophagoides pteronyssinus]|uniref:Uncharacterized protein n=1 Tax=Dermatophagoides pteronyssinus TaxID=6956 RepID=A0ABQ8IXA6_DERPT|nr:hypothetical protein DERP_014130 [Dermatophagoides pteronyssinus]